MKRKRFFLSIFIGIVAAYFLALLAFTFEENYREFIRNLDQQLTENKISFKNDVKSLHFASGEFISAFVIFLISKFILLKRQENKQRIKNIVLGMLLIIISTIVICYIDSNGKLIECTACDNGRRVLGFNDINYDFIFITSLLFGILPTILTEIKNRKRKQAGH
jgi:glycerol uptake facilitator-like aquaporin